MSIISSDGSGIVAGFAIAATTVASTAFGIISAGVLTTLNPLGGAVYGLGFVWGGGVGIALLDEISALWPSARETLGIAMPIITAIGIGLSITYVGFPLTFTSGVSLAVGHLVCFAPALFFSAIIILAGALRLVCRR